MPSTPDSPASRSSSSLSAWRGASLVSDALLIFMFAALGRRTHESGMDPGGILWTALPFLLAWAAATAATRPDRTCTRLWPAGVVVWVVTVIGGLLLRVLFGDTAAPSFQLVTAVVLGVFLLGRRAVTTLVVRARRPSRT
ncbi:DUF3054 domain-containing protein [Citricoccus sp. GCM10030269]|uniref:DUF3054 domain-containing protein n=1 Tax=Citricoccus sp. GCM10030269 TaxID=3273388 RepID=UPI0036064AB9